MDDFVQWDSWWTAKYLTRLGAENRFYTAKLALNLLFQRGGRTIVETGTTRADDDFAGAGMSTVFFGDFCKRHDCHLWTVDISANAMAISRELTREYRDFITYVEQDSIAFLSKFDQPIDLLYLDSLDCPPDNRNPADLERSQRHQVQELRTAWDKLTEQSIVLLDDNDFPNGGKCLLSNRFLAREGWTCLLAGRQVVWTWDAPTRLRGICPD